MERIEDLAAAAHPEADRDWVCEAVERISADYTRSADTHLVRLDLGGGINLYLKDESTHPTGSLKHRLARSLFLYGLCNGWIGRGTPIIEASSGSTAISEAYFARLLGLPFIAVLPEGTAPEKVVAIEFMGGECREVAQCAIYDEAEALAARLGGYYMDQFTYAERATDWRGNNNMAESLFSQMAREPHPVPDWVVMSAGTGDSGLTIGTGSRIEGIGRPRVEPSFKAGVIDRMMRVPDAASIAAILWLERVLGRKCGGSTGTNLVGALRLVEEMRTTGRQGSLATLICDPGERYLGSYYDPAWVEAQGLDTAPWLAWLEGFAPVS